jgi:hypothetical protein
MKYQHMSMVMDWKADLKEQQAAYAIEQMSERQTILYHELLSLDLAGEAWFDDNNNVPEYGGLRERINILEKRIADLKIPQPLEPRREPFTGIPASA